MCRRVRFKRLVGLVVGLLVFLGWVSGALAATEVTFWHAMTGTLEERVNDLVKKFNDSQKDYVVVPLRKGSYPETLTAAIAAYRAKTPPDIVQVFEVGTQTMLSSNAIYPVYQLMQEQGIAVNWDDFLGPVRSYYSKDGHLYSMPFNSSTPILYYNKGLFKKAGLADKPPTTFDEIGKDAKQLVSSGATKCGFSNAWPSWLMIENMHAWHDQPIANNDNGFKDLATKLLINDKVGVETMTTLARWQKEGIYTYGGRGPKAEAMFAGGECGIFSTSSGFIGGLVQASTGKFQWGTGDLPRFKGYPQGDSIIGGATLWVMKAKPAEYAGVAQFFRFLAETENQMWWHKNTGYLPISNAAVKALEASGYFKEKPYQFQAFHQIASGKVTPNSQGIRLGNFVSIRDAVEAEMELILNGQKTAKQGLTDAVKKGDEILKEFAALYK